MSDLKTMSSAQEKEQQQRMLDAERAWHDKDYEAYAATAYCDSADDFQKRYIYGQLTAFCDGGWSWWGDARDEMLKSLGAVRGKSILDYGCGFGTLGNYLALQGAIVRGFDLSQPAVDTANRAAAHYGLSSQFAQMDASELTYPDSFFDLVVGFGVLHHVVKYSMTGHQLYRVLKPGGFAVFHETLWDNPLINFARRFTTVDSAAGDAALTEKAIRAFAREFRGINLEKRHFLYMLKRFADLPDSSWDASLRPRPLWRGVKALDRQLLRVRPMRRYCGEVIIYLQK